MEELDRRSDDPVWNSGVIEGRAPEGEGTILIDRGKRKNYRENTAEKTAEDTVEMTAEKTAEEL